MKHILLITVLALGLVSAVAQKAQTERPTRPSGPSTVQCEGMKKLMEQVRNHRATCECCKTNLQRGVGMGRGPGGPPR